MSNQRLIQNNQDVAKEHYAKTGHGKFSFTGANKKEKLEGVYCKECKKYIGTIKFKSSKQRRG